MTTIYDEHGLIYVWFEINYSENEGIQSRPKTMQFGFSRLPIKGEWLQVGSKLWVVKQVIHHEMTPEIVEECKRVQGKVFVATIQVDYYGDV